MSAQTALERTQLTIACERGELVLDAGRVALRTPALAGDEPTCVEFGVDRIRDTHLRAPSRGGRGWLHVGVVGGSPAPPGELAAVGDPYTLPLTASATPAARRFCRLVERHVRSRGMPTDVGVDPSVGSTAVSVTQVPPPSAAPAPPARADHPAGAPPTPSPDGAASPASPASGGASPAARAGAELVRELQALAELHAGGALSDAEFERAKARLLG